MSACHFRSLRPNAAPLLLLAVLAGTLSGCGGTVPAPTEFKTWNAKDGTFQLEYPAGWEAKGGGKNRVQWAKFQKGSALIEVRVSVAGSLLGDIAGSGLPMDPAEQELTPAHAVHDLGRDTTANQFGGYQETNGQDMQLPIGSAFVAEFTGSSGMASMHGYRVTALGNDRAVTVVLRCSKGNWETLQPAFLRIVNSLDHGSPSI